jgi:heat induced stress protein YflT
VTTPSDHHTDKTVPLPPTPATDPGADATQPVPAPRAAADDTIPVAGGVPVAGERGVGVPPGPAGTVPSLPGATAGARAGAVALPTVVVGTYPDYAQAQQAVDLLSDNKFPVERTAIIGTDLRLVENVLGRLTTGRAALAGAASGAWFGLFIGLLFGLFSNSSWFAVILVCLLIGAAWGAIFGAIAHAATGGRRDFASRSTLQAGQYAVVTDPEVADQARQHLISLNWRASGAE